MTKIMGGKEMTKIQEIIAELKEYHNPDDTTRLIALLETLDVLNDTLMLRVAKRKE